MKKTSFTKVAPSVPMWRSRQMFHIKAKEWLSIRRCGELSLWEKCGFKWSWKRTSSRKKQEFPPVLLSFAVVNVSPHFCVFHCHFPCPFLKNLTRTYPSHSAWKDGLSKFCSRQLNESAGSKQLVWLNAASSLPRSKVLIERGTSPLQWSSVSIPLREMEQQSVLVGGATPFKIVHATYCYCIRHTRLVMWPLYSSFGNALGLEQQTAAKCPRSYPKT